jgi:hypothetical protein
METRVGTLAYTNLRDTTGPDTNSSHGARWNDILFCPVLTANRTWILVALGASDRVRLTIHRPAARGAFTLTVWDQVSPAIAVFAASGAGTADFFWNGTAWIALAKTANVT